MIIMIITHNYHNLPSQPATIARGRSQIITYFVEDPHLPPHTSFVIMNALWLTRSQVFGAYPGYGLWFKTVNLIGMVLYFGTLLPGQFLVRLLEESYLQKFPRWTYRISSSSSNRLRHVHEKLELTTSQLSHRPLSKKQTPPDLQTTAWFPQRKSPGYSESALGSQPPLPIKTIIYHVYPHHFYIYNH
jgi:hypothetical protein